MQNMSDKQQPKFWTSIVLVMTLNYKYKKKFVILQSIGIIVIKSKETRVIT